MSGEDILNIKVKINISFSFQGPIVTTAINYYKPAHWDFSYLFKDLAQSGCPTNTLLMLGELVFQASNLAKSSTEDTINIPIYVSMMKFTISEAELSYKTLLFIFQRHTGI